MRCTLSSKCIKFLSRTISLLSRFSNEVRIRTTETEFFVEVLKGEFALGQLKIDRDHFTSWDPSSPVDVFFKSKSLRQIFHNSNNIAKNSAAIEIWIEDKLDHAYFRITPQNYPGRVIKIPKMILMKTTRIIIPDTELFAVHVESDCKTWLAGLKLFHNIELVTTRFRFRRCKMETGDEECFKSLQTTFNFHANEFKQYDVREEMICTYALRPVIDFLTIWDPQRHVLESFYDPTPGIPVVFLVTDDSGWEAKLVLAKVSRKHKPDILSDSEDDGEAQSIANATPQCQAGTSRQDPRNRFIFHSDAKRNSNHQTLPQPFAYPTSSVNSTFPRSTLHSINSTAGPSTNMVSEGAEEEFDDDGMDDLPTHTLTASNAPPVVSAGADEFDDGDDVDMDAINETTRVLSQGALSNGNLDVENNLVDETFGIPIHHSTQAGFQIERNNHYDHDFDDISENNNSGDFSFNITSVQQYERQCRLMLSQDEDRPQEYEYLAPDTDDEDE